ncbi:hypothetical protein [Proteus mirabilis]|uniref:hypothetical protein n=1 Tax=Proteus mirabilis TaxID=584 RepID=UPI0029E646B2|nr:zinc ribbon domain-containing protein [Proteus mirabilis]HEK0682754.1 zinc ribbon domain-containing protein [Proteus mirabilis]
MKGFGWVLLIIGIIVAFAAFNMDVSVATSYGGRVNNFGLMAQRQNYILISCFVIFCGLMMVIFGGRKSIESGQVKCPFCAELISNEAIKCKHCGSDLSEHKRLQKEKETNLKIKFNAINYDQTELYDTSSGKAVLNYEKLAKLVQRIKFEDEDISGEALLARQKFNIETIQSLLPKEIKKEFRDKVSQLILDSFIKSDKLGELHYRFISIDNGNYRINKDEIKKFAEYLISKLPYGHDVFTDFNDEISKAMKSIPSDVRGDFMSNLHHFVYGK